MSVSFDIKGKVALITGGASGIGEACVLTFGRAGAKELIADLNVELGEKVTGSVRQSGGEAHFVRVDTAKEWKEPAPLYRSPGFLEIEPYSDSPYSDKTLFMELKLR
jgi:NAD(P)-dependent dehydrogenase (short-subunit alcohol dehydrogenase family)